MKKEAKCDLPLCGKSVQVDQSGVGHCWLPVTAEDLTPETIREIEAVILDGGLDTCAAYTAANGLTYRW